MAAALQCPQWSLAGPYPGQERLSGPWSVQAKTALPPRGRGTWPKAYSLLAGAPSIPAQTRPLGCQALVSCARPTSLLDHDPYHSASLWSFPDPIWSWVMLSSCLVGLLTSQGHTVLASPFTLITPPPGSDGARLVGFAKHFLSVAVLHQKCQCAPPPQALSLHPFLREKKRQPVFSLANTRWFTILAI